MQQALSTLGNCGSVERAIERAYVHGLFVGTALMAFLFGLYVAILYLDRGKK